MTPMSELTPNITKQFRNTQIINKIPVSWILFTLAIFSLGIIVYGIWLDQKDPSKFENRRKIIITSFLVSFVLATLLFAQIFIAINKGMNSLSVSLPDMIQGIQTSPTQDKMPHDLNNTIIILYRFECDDCRAIYPDLKEYLDKHKTEQTKVYFIPSRSNSGKKFVEFYNIEFVPTGIHIKKQNSNNPQDFTIKNLSTTNFGDIKTPILDKDAIQRLLDLQTETRKENKQ